MAGGAQLAVVSSGDHVSDARNRSTRSRLGRAPLFTEVAAVALTPAAAVRFHPDLRARPRTYSRIVAAAVASSALAIILRQLRVPLILAAPISLFVLGAWLVNLLAPGTTEFARPPHRGDTNDPRLPSPTRPSSSSVAQRAPVEAIDGFLAAAAVGSVGESRSSSTGRRFGFAWPSNRCCRPVCSSCSAPSSGPASTAC